MLRNVDSANRPANTRRLIITLPSTVVKQYRIGITIVLLNSVARFLNDEVFGRKISSRLITWNIGAFVFFFDHHNIDYIFYATINYSIHRTICLKRGIRKSIETQMPYAIRL